MNSKKNESIDTSIEKRIDFGSRSGGLSIIILYGAFFMGCVVHFSEPTSSRKTNSLCFEVAGLLSTHISGLRFLNQTHRQIVVSGTLETRVGFQELHDGFMRFQK
jgi:hypothetical protein